MHRMIVWMLCIMVICLAGCAPLQTQPTLEPLDTDPMVLETEPESTETDPPQTDPPQTQPPATSPPAEPPILLELPHYRNTDAEFEENERTMVTRSEDILISGYTFAFADNEAFSDYADQYPQILDYILSQYPRFQRDQWRISVNLFSDDGDGIMKLNYVISGKIQTNKSILFMIQSHSIVSASFINMEFQADEAALIGQMEEFLRRTQQEKKILAENEAFLSEDTTFTYLYNLDKLIYTYQLFFLQTFGETTVINNEFGSEYVVSEVLDRAG